MDELKTEIQISVRELVRHVLRSGDLVPTFSGSRRALEGTRAHQKIQKNRPSCYSSEVSISHRIESGQVSLRVEGRIDGVYSDENDIMPGKVIIDEIKTIAIDSEPLTPESFPDEENPLHWGQLKVYAYIYAKEHGFSEIGIQLTYCDPKTDTILEIRKTATVEELKVFFDGLVSDFINWAERIADRKRVRDESILNIPFPFPSFRKGQRDMAVAVYRTILNNGYLMAQAATGIGKTMGALFPSVKALVKKKNAGIFYLTARTTGRSIAEKALDEMRSSGLRFTSLTLTAKDKICFKPDAACTPEECEFAEGYYNRLRGAVWDMFRHEAFTREKVEGIAGKHQVCPFEFSLELSNSVDCVICDYNYAFDPRVYLRRFFSEISGDYIFLIDEAHNLVDRARDMFSATIRKQQIPEVMDAIGNELPIILKSLKKVNGALSGEWKKRSRKKGPIAEKEAPKWLIPVCSAFIDVTEKWLSENKNADFRDALMDLYFCLTWFVRVLDEYDENYVTIYKAEGNELTIRLYCLDPSHRLKEALERCGSAIFFSATLTPPSYFARMLGCRDIYETITLPSPFPPENLDILVAGNLSTYYRDRQKTVNDLRDLIKTLIKSEKGNYLIFFPSYAYLNLVWTSEFSSDALEVRSNDGIWIRQAPGMVESDRDQFLERFSEKNTETLIGFVVMGGIFGEGVDLLGDRLTGAAIVGVGLPGICPEREKIRDFFDAGERTGFDFAYLYPGINRVLQAAGRVIRSETDRGIVVLIDKRFSTFRYRSLMPSHWNPIFVRNLTDFRETLNRIREERKDPDHDLDGK